MRKIRVTLMLLLLGFVLSSLEVSAAPEDYRYVKVLISRITINPGAVTHENTRADVYWTVERFTWEYPSWVNIGTSATYIDFEGTLTPNWETYLWRVPQDVQWVQFRISVWDYDVARADGDNEPDLLDVASSAADAWYDVNIWFNIYEGIYGRADPHKGDVYIGESGGRDGSITFDVLTQPTVETTNEAGVIKNYFLPGQNVSVKGSGYSPSETYDIYVVVDVPTWSFGMSLTRVPDTENQTFTDASGNLPVQPVWIQARVPGKYDIVVDIDQTGTFSAGDVLDSSDIFVTAGFNVVPELPFGTVTAVLSWLAVLALFKRKRFMRAH